MGHRIDTTQPSPARVYDYLVGGKDNWAVDRAAADTVLEVAPEARDLAVHNRQFLGRVVRYAAAHGIRQYLDLGSGLPTAENVHQVAQRTIPDSHVVYVDNDPVVLAHGHALLATSPGTLLVDADVRDHEHILAEASRALDFDQPVALLMISVLHFVEDPLTVARGFVDRLPPGSLVALSHVTDEGAPPELLARIDTVYGNAPVPLRLRPRADIAALLCGLDPVEPGLVDVPRWHPDDDTRPGPLRILGAAAWTTPTPD